MDSPYGKFYIFRSKATILTMSRPARVWLFNRLRAYEFRPMQSIGSGYAMAGGLSGNLAYDGEIGARAEFSGAGRSFRIRNRHNHNTWYAATMVMLRWEIPYVTVTERN